MPTRLEIRRVTSFRGNDEVGGIGVKMLPRTRTRHDDEDDWRLGPVCHDSDTVLKSPSAATLCPP